MSDLTLRMQWRPGPRLTVALARKQLGGLRIKIREQPSEVGRWMQPPWMEHRAEW